MNRYIRRQNSYALEFSSRAKVKNTVTRYITCKRRVISKVSGFSGVTTENYNTMIAKVIIYWTGEHIPEGLWKPTVSVYGAKTFAISS